MFVFKYDCPRGRKDCKPISNIVADDQGDSFFCCGQNDGSIAPVKQDLFTQCFKGEHRDDMTFNDKRDLVHQSAVLISAVAWIEDQGCELCHKSVDERFKDE